MKYNKNVLKKSYAFLICLIIFLIPSNLFLKINPTSAYVNGLLVDYLIPKLYLSDVPIIILLSLWSIEVILIEKKKFIFTAAKLYLPSILISLIIVRQIFTPYPLSAVWYLFKLIEIGLLGWFLVAHQKLFQQKIIYYTITATIWFQSLLAVWQFINQKPLLGYIFLGETNLANSIGLAKDVWWQTGRVLPYGTSGHPNILGGILAILSLFLINKFLKTNQKKNLLLTSATILLAIFTIILTQSISATLALAIGLILIFKKKLNSKNLVIGGLLLFFTVPLAIGLAAKKLPHSDSLTRRSYLQTAAIKMFAKNPIVGVGLNQFTARVEEYSHTQEVVRFVQPTHHLGLLWLAETGVLGVWLIWILIKKQSQKIILPFLILLPMATLDHYLLTQQSGLLLLIFTLNLLMEKDWEMDLVKARGWE